MLYPNEPQYSLAKPPIMLISRTVTFTCAVCQRPGIGPPNAKVHQGKCHTLHTKKLMQRNAERRKLRSLREHAQVA